MIRPTRRWMSLALVACLGVPAGPPAVAQESAAREIVVAGRGVVRAVPDMAEVRLGVMAEAREAQVAMDRVSEDIDRLLATLDALGVAPRDIQTTTLRLDPVFSRAPSDGQGGPELRGFTATNDLTVWLRDMALLGEALQALLEGGVNRVSSVSFSLADPAPLEAEARRAAVADAQARAALYAEAAGVALGPVQSIVEGGVSGAEPVMGARMAMEAAVPIAAGELEIVARVTITYAIRG